MELPTSRDTVLHYFEQMKKAFPELRNFYTRESGDLVLEGDKEQESYRWLAIEPRRLCSGQVNPEALEEAYRQHEMVLDLAPPPADDQPARLRGARRDVRLRLHVRGEPRRGGRRGARGGHGPGGPASSVPGGPGDQLRAVADAGAGRGAAGSSAGSRSRPEPTPTRSGPASSPRTRSAFTSPSASTGGPVPR